MIDEVTIKIVKISDRYEYCVGGVKESDEWFEDQELAMKEVSIRIKLAVGLHEQYPPIK